MGGSEGRWTPRPWRLHDTERFTIVNGQSGMAIAHCNAKRDDAENEANTLLVRAAPDLLVGAISVEAALTVIQDILADYIHPDSGIPETEVVNRILAIADRRDVVIAQRELREAIEQALAA